MIYTMPIPAWCSPSCVTRPQRILGRVEVPALATILAVLLGVSLLGVLGALSLSQPPPRVQLLTRELVMPRLDQV